MNRAGPKAFIAYTDKKGDSPAVISDFEKSEI